MCCNFFGGGTYERAPIRDSYHRGDSDGYWAYPMRTNSVPYSDQPPGATPGNTRVGNFYKDDGFANGYDDGYAVTGSLGLSLTQNYLTDVGAYSSSSSFYGTFDQGGNVREWNETRRGTSALSQLKTRVCKIGRRALAHGFPSTNRTLAHSG
jgi:hypothetical protein